MPSNPLPPRFKDRYRVPDDFGKLDLDIREEPRIPPSVGIFDIPYRCYVVNEEWDAHISGAISALAEWRAWVGDDDERDASVQEVLKFLAQEGDCSVVQLQVRQNESNPCILEYSTNGGADWVEFADILDCVTEDFLESAILNAINTDTAIQDAIDDLTDGGTDNELPPMPTSSEPDELCDAAYYMVDKIIAFIDQTLTDASTITLDEFLTALLGLGGFDASLLKLFWDFIVANSYPDLLDDVEAARDEVAEILYCNELDKEAVITPIDDSATIGTEAQAALIGAINAVTDGKWALWAFVGSQIDSGEDCSEFCGDWVWESTFEDDENIWSPFNNVGEDEAIWTNGVGYTSADAQNAVDTWSRLIFIETSTFPTLATITQVQFEYSLGKGSYTSDAPALHISLGRDSGGREIQQNAASISPAGSNLLYTFNLTHNDYQDIWLYVRSSAINGSEVYSGSCELHSVRVSGVGFNPFE